jgi:outer membrane protein OmpU
MKKAILGTTALVAVSALAVGSASAADKIKLGVGGYMQSTYYYGDFDSDKGTAASSVNLDRISDKVTQEGEVFFTGETTLDNGLKFGVNIQLEAYQSTDQIDETYIFLQGSFGRVLLGSEDSAAYLMHYDAPSPVPMYSGDSPNIYPIGTTNTTRPTLFSDSDKVSYFTPRFAGFQLGGSYVPNASEEAGGTGNAYSPPQIEMGRNSGYSIAGNYVNKLGGVDVAVSAGYNSVDVTAATAGGGADLKDMTQWSVGTQVGFAGFTVGGGYAESSDIGGAAGFDNETYSLGVTYGMGPWKVGVQYSNQEQDYSAAIADGELEIWTVGGQYTLGPGITAFGGVQFYDNSLTTNAASAAAASSVGLADDSTIIFIGTALSF